MVRKYQLQRLVKQSEAVSNSSFPTLFPQTKFWWEKRGKRFGETTIQCRTDKNKYNMMCFLKIVSRRGPPRQGVQGPAGALLRLRFLPQFQHFLRGTGKPVPLFFGVMCKSVCNSRPVFTCSTFTCATRINCTYIKRFSA